MLDTYEAIASVLGSGANPEIKGIYGIDAIKYSWVDLYLRDQAARAEIKNLEADIERVGNLPICREELKARFIMALEKINSLMLRRMKIHLAGVQNRTENLIDEDGIARFNVVRPLFLTGLDIEEMFSDLQPGTPQAEIDEAIRAIKDKISTIKGRIASELSPQSRWVHHDSGEPMHYPNGCRWTAFVEDWKKVASRFEGRVNIEGFSLESGAEETAYTALGLDKVRKASPLRKPRVVRPPDKYGKELYEASVSMSATRRK